MASSTPTRKDATCRGARNTGGNSYSSDHYTIYHHKIIIESKAETARCPPTCTNARSPITISTKGSTPRFGFPRELPPGTP